MATAWGRIFLIYGAGVLAAGQLGVVAPLVPALQLELDLTLALVGLILSAITAVGAALGFAAGAAVERSGYLRAVALGLAILTVATIGCAFANSGLMLLAARIIAGIGYLLIVVAAPSLLARLAARRDQPVALALWGTFVPAGIALAQALSGVLATPIGWRAVFLADGVALALMLLAVWMARTPERETMSRAGFGRAHLSLRPMLLAAAFFCFALTFLGVAGLLAAYFIDQRGFGVARAGSIIAATTSCGVLGSLAAGWLMRRGVSSGRLAGAGLLLAMALSPVIFSAAASDGLVIAATALSFTIGGLVPAATFASIPLLARDASAIGPLNGLVAQTGSLGSLAGPPLVALWVEALGWTTAPILLLAIAATGTACVLAIGPAPRAA